MPSLWQLQFELTCFKLGSYTNAQTYVNEVHAPPACFSFLGMLDDNEKAPALLKYTKVLTQWLVGEFNVSGFGKLTGIDGFTTSCTNPDQPLVNVEGANLALDAAAIHAAIANDEQEEMQDSDVV